MKIETPTIESIITQWEKDSIVDTTDPGKEIIHIPVLHSKYNKYLSLHNLSAKKCGLEISKLKKLKWLYYTGKLDREELEKLGWEPFRFTLKSDISVYVEGDGDLSNLKRRQAYHEEAASFCIYVMKELNNRTWQLKEFINWEKFQQGAH